MAWVRCCGGSSKKVTDLYMLNNSSMTWETKSSVNVTPTYSYPTLVGDMILQSGNAGYCDTYELSPLIDFTHFSTLKITGSCTNASANTARSFIQILDPSDVLVAEVYRYNDNNAHTVNVNLDVSTYTGEFKIKIAGFCMNNYNGSNYNTRYRLTECTLYV